MNRILGLMMLYFFAAVLARADLIPILLSSTPIAGNNFANNYAAVLTAGTSLDPAMTDADPKARCDPGNVTCSPSGTFFTFYDFGGFVAVNVTAPGWVATIQMEGFTPTLLTTPPPDSGLQTNVTFFYIDRSPSHVITGPTTISGFQIISAFAPLGMGSFSSEWTGTGTGVNAVTTQVNPGSTMASAGSVALPSAPAAIPEPGSALLVGGGLLAAALTGRRRRSLTE